MLRHRRALLCLLRLRGVSGVVANALQVLQDQKEECILLALALHSGRVLDALLLNALHLSVDAVNLRLRRRARRQLRHHPTQHLVLLHVLSRDSCLAQLVLLGLDVALGLLNLRMQGLLLAHVARLLLGLRLADGAELLRLLFDDRGLPQEQSQRVFRRRVRAALRFGNQVDKSSGELAEWRLAPPSGRAAQEALPDDGILLSSAERLARHTASTRRGASAASRR
mmetsp:Transcript_982/g.2638  ORF Transcript_982/g.2638 Transcript_982/m.2638 type:complete len:225 (-) Transcript_982:62-736(-)